MMFSTSIPGQSIMGTILGTVSDASGAVVPGATVIVRNQDTGIEQRTVTDASGLYQALNLIRGRYTVRVEQPGFKRFDVVGLLLESATTVRADARLETGDLSSSIEVKGEAPVIDTETMDVSDARDGQTMVRLPLNVRGSFNGYYYDMVRLTPGVVASSSNNFSFGGTRTYQFTTGVDGIVTNGVLYGNSTGTAQSGLDFTQEFRVQLANGNAEFSTPGGFFATTKSGANEMHGSLFHYYAGSKLNARNTFAKSAPFGILNNFGGTVGGPIIRNRTFYYAGVERFVQRSNATINATTPTLAMRRGDFGSILGDTEIMDPLSGSPFPNNVIPPSRLSPVSTKLQDIFYPAPNYGSPDEYGSNYRSVLKNTPFKTQIETRIDHRFNDANSFYGRVSWNRGATNGWPANLPTIPKTDQDRRTLFFAFGDTHSFTPTLLNEVRAGVMRHRNIFYSPINGVDLIKNVGMQGLTSNFLKPWGFPQIWFDNFDAIAIDDDVYGEYYERTFQIGDNLTWIRDRHTLKFGVDLRRNSGMTYPVAPSYAFGDFSFDGSFSDFDYADFLMGIPTVSSRWNPAPIYHLVNTDVSLFVQDDWKVTPKLTLNLGLRYDYNPPYSENDGRIFNFDPGSGRLIVPGEDSLKWVNSAFPSSLAPIVPAGTAGFPSSLLHPYRLNFTPRLGFAYRPFSNDLTVIRGGYGLYTDVISAQLFDATAVGGPFISSESFTNEIVNGAPLFAFPRAFPGGFGEAGAQRFTAVDPNLRNPRIQQWSLTVERNLKGIGLRASYIGTNNRHAMWAPNLNQLPPSTVKFDRSRQAFPEFRSVGFSTNGGNQNYHGLHVVAEQKASNGLYFQLGWVWAKDLTDTLKEGKAATPPQDSYARFLDRSDVSYVPRHSVNGNLAYELPFGPGRRWLSGSNSVVKNLLGGWSVSSILTMRSGLFFNPTFSGFDVSNTNTTSGRPDRIANGNLPTDQRNIYRWFDAKAFVVPGDTNGDGRPDVNVGRFGNSAPNVLVGPGLFTMNAGLHKSIPLGERARLLLQGTFTNATNHVNYNLPNANIRSTTVGRITSAGAARGGQIAARIEF
jgi:hypothetical protein